MRSNLIVSFLIFIFFPLHSYSQSVTFNDLKYILYHTIEESETYLLEKDFLFYCIIDHEDGSYSNNYAKNVDNASRPIVISTLLYKDFSFGSSFYTDSKDDYLLLKSSIKELGFVLKLTERENQSIVYYYELDNFILSFQTSFNKQYGSSDYYIYLFDKVLQEEFLKMEPGLMKVK